MYGWHHIVCTYEDLVLFLEQFSSYVLHKLTKLSMILGKWKLCTFPNAGEQEIGLPGQPDNSIYLEAIF